MCDINEEINNKYKVYMESTDDESVAEERGLLPLLKVDDKPENPADEAPKDGKLSPA